MSSITDDAKGMLNTEEIETERKRFEEWFEAAEMPLEADWFKRDADGNYDVSSTAHTWDGWLARAEESRSGQMVRLCAAGGSVILCDRDLPSSPVTLVVEIGDEAFENLTAAIRRLKGPTK